MALTNEQRAILEKRGPAQIRMLLVDARAAGYGVTSDVRLAGPGIPDPSRGDVEDWLSETDAEAARIDAERYDNLLFWAKIAGLTGIAAVVIGLVTIYLTIRPADPPAATPAAQHSP